MAKELLFRYSNRFLSKWMVLGIDLIIVSFAAIFATLLRRNFNLESVDFELFKFNFTVLLGFKLLFFLFFQSFSGIVRHTSLEDTLNIFKTVFFGSVGGAMFAWAYRFQFDFWQFLDSTFTVYVIDFFLSLFCLVGFRLVVKFAYETIFKSIKPNRFVLIFGAGQTGRLTKNVFISDRNQNYQVLGFIDDNSSIRNKSVEGVMVYSLEDAIDKFSHLWEHLEVVMAVNKIPLERKQSVSEAFLERGIVVKTLAPVNKWVGGEININQINNVKIEDLLGRDVIQTNNPQIAYEISSKTVLVTGAAGSIGSEIIRQLIKYLPSTLILIDQAESALYDMEYELLPKVPSNMKWISIVADVNDAQRMGTIFKEFKPDFVFHAAAYKHVPLMENNPYEAVKTNVMGTKILADLSVEHAVYKFIMVSTDKAVNPTNIMGATKRMAEMYTQSLNGIEEVRTKFIATRFGNVLGSNGSVIPLFRRQIENGGPVTVTHPDITRYFMTIPEACQLVLEAAAMGDGGEVFVFDMGKSVRIMDLANRMITLSGYKVGKDIEIKVTGLRPGEKLYEELLSDKENTLPTHHEKILIAKVNYPAFEKLEAQILELSDLLEYGNMLRLVAKMKEIIPEYKSNNSVFEHLDKVTVKIKK